MTDPYASIAAAVTWSNVGSCALLIGLALASVYCTLSAVYMLVNLARGKY